MLSLAVIIYLGYDWDWAAAEAEVKRALAIDPTDPLALNAAGRLSAALGRWDDAERQFRRHWSEIHSNHLRDLQSRH